jgi:hypothetical protein
MSSSTPPTISAQNQNINLWESLKGIVLFLGIYLFFIGWVYLTTYFRQFGVTAANIKIELHDYYVYGFYSIQRSTALMVTLLLFLLLCIVLLQIKSKAPIKYSILGIAAIVIFPISYPAARSAAIDRAKELSHRKSADQIPDVYIFFKNDYLADLSKSASTTSDDSVTHNSLIWANDYRQSSVKSLYYAMKKEQLVELYQNDETLYVFCNTDSTGKDPNPRVFVYAFDKKDIEFYINKIFQ